MGLTPRQAEILAYVTKYCEEHGYAPTLQEVGKHMGLSSVATVHKHVGQLVAKGYLKRARPNASRDLEVVPRAEQGARQV
ncbi:repressor LexA, partial [bacterium]